MNNIFTDLASAAKGKNLGAYNPAGYVVGKVVENNNKEFQGLVKVEFISWLSGKNICDWIPVLQPYAGATYGRYIIPEIDDTVLVGFMESHLRKPFVLGSFYPANAQYVKDSFNDKNFLKTYKTKGGISLKLNDEKGKESVIAETPVGIKMSVEDETQLVTLTDKEGKNLIKLDAKNGKIEVLSDKEISFTSGKCKITISGEKGAVSIEADKVDIAAKQTMTAEGKQKMALKGGEMNIAGSQKTAMSGGAMTEIKGGILKLN